MEEIASSPRPNQSSLLSRCSSSVQKIWSSVTRFFLWAPPGSIWISEDYQLEMNIWDWAMTCLFLFWKHLAITDWIEDNHHCQVLRCWYRMTFSDINYPITMSTMQAREDRLIGRILDPTHPTHLPAPISLGSPLRGLKFVICDPCAASTLCDPL